MAEMKAAVYNGVDDMTVTTRPVPKLEDGETLIKVKYCGICGTDLHVLHGHHATATFPRIPGHELVGEVVEAKGAGAERFAKGELVVGQPVIACGHCDACGKGQDNVCTSLKILGLHADGGFAEYVKVKTNKVFRLPQQMDPQLAALTEPLAVAVHDVRMSGLQVGETAFVAGGGPIGLLIAMVARKAGACLTVVSEVNDYRRGVAESLGFTTVNPLDADFEEKIAQLHGGRGFDVCFEAAGAPGVLDTCVKLAKSSGRVVVIAIASTPTPVDTAQVFFKQLQLIGVRLHSQFNFQGAVDLLFAGEMEDELRALISKVFPLNDFTKALDYAEHGKDAFKVLVQVSE